MAKTFLEVFAHAKNEFLQYIDVHVDLKKLTPFRLGLPWKWKVTHIEILKSLYGLKQDELVGRIFANKSLLARNISDTVHKYFSQSRTI